MDLAQVITALKQERSQVGSEGNWSNPNALSEIGLKLATYMTYLGEHLPKLESEYLSDRSELYATYIIDSSATAAENRARYETIKQREQYETVKQLHKDFSSLISMLQSRLRILTNEAKGNI